MWILALGYWLAIATPKTLSQEVVQLFPPISFGQTPTPGVIGAYYDDINFGVPDRGGLVGTRPSSAASEPGLAPALGGGIGGVFGPVFTRNDGTINFDFGNGPPDPRIAPDTFSIRWTGRIVPAASGNYTFFTITDDGVRLWVNNQLIIDKFINQSATKHASLPIFLEGGWVYDVRMDYYEGVGAAVAKLLWSGPGLAEQVVPFAGGPNGADANFGAALASLGGGRFAVGAPLAEISGGTVFNQRFYNDAGLVSLFDVAGAPSGAGLAPINNQRRQYGNALAAFEDGRFLVGSANADAATGTQFYTGTVFLQDTNGTLLGTWTSPDNFANRLQFFGYRVATVPGNRFLVSSGAGKGKVFIFDAAAVAPPALTITNPTPSGLENFGHAVAAFGGDRLLIGDPGDDAVLGTYGSVMIYDLAGNLLKTIPNPVQADVGTALFGAVVVPVNEHQFLIGAPGADASFVDGNGTLANNQSAGAVYLYDDTGSQLRKFLAPDLARSGYFGAAVTLLGPGRVLIGAPFDKQGTTPVGRVHLFNLEGTHLEAIDNPAPNEFDRFGDALAALDERRFAVGALDDDTLRPNGGSVYGFDAPLPVFELGAEIPRPNGVDASGLFPTRGPAVAPADAAFWHPPSGKLFAVKPGGVLVTWPLLGGRSDNLEASIVWPTDAAKFQLHVAGPGTVNVSDGSAFPEILLHATTAGASVVANGNQRLFSAAAPGDSFLMLSAGPPTNTPIRFQLVRSFAATNPAHLHDDAPAIVGEPVVDPAGYHNPACGVPQVINLAGIFCPPPVYDPAARTGTIIPVNRDNAATEGDDLIVAFFQHGTKLIDPVTGASVANTICWPYKPVRFRPDWPLNPQKIIVASQLGTGPIDPALFVDWQLYFQNDPNQVGFNPNDEHALRRPSGAAEAVFALRDDLGTPTTSEPHVLIHYLDPGLGQRRMKVWKVVAEEAPFFFNYPARAGLLIQAPFPISALALAPETAGVSGPYWRDRKLFFWAKAAGDDGGSADIVMRYFYPVQPGFFFPGANPPQLGMNVPLLDLRAGTPGTPIDVHFDTVWPADVPELRVGETLVKPKSGLPQIAGQSSVEVLYEQAMAQENRESVRLIDPVRTRSVSLAQLPSDVETRVSAGLFYFPTLPPHLEGRVSYDNVTKRLQLRGQFVEPPAGESYLLLNVLTPRDRAALLALSTDALFRSAVNALAATASGLLIVPPESAGFDSLALTAGRAAGTGYVTLAFGNSTILSAPAEPISLSIIKVSCPLYRGELKVIESPNPLAEQLTLRHSGDFAGRPDDFEFEWRTLPPVDGLPSPLPPEQWTPFQPAPATGIGALDITIAGPGLFTLSDNYFIARYRRVTGVDPCGGDFSAWTAPMLAEGWIKRVLAGINPFEQRIKDYQNTAANTIVSMISQAGARAVGDVALNLNAVNQAGLIETYETVLRRGMNLSIDGAPPVDYPPANDALLLAAGRLADLYMLLGNEATADATDPTIGFGTDDGVFGAQATSLHCFMNQTASLLEEELTLLRGRDNSKLPSVHTHPVYNRLIWNFTRDITGGEVAYALNYNIRDINGDVAGAIDEADAKRLYPQGHGDAWGHYLIAIKNYYRLLRNPNFTWVPRIEAVIVGGVPVSVDFLDERKFAAAAAARARTGAETVSLSFRESYLDTPGKPWQTQPDSDANRAWGIEDWATRAGQGAFFDWVVANAMLPDADPNPSHTGIQKIDRSTVRELSEITEAYREIQEHLDQADSGRNPLGLAADVVPFDIDPGAIGAGKTHFEQINERANEALKNAVAVFDHANASTQLLRRQADSQQEFQQRVTDGEADFNSRLIEIFGTPYTDDIGPTGTYPTGYTGPDVYHYDYVDSPEIRAGASIQQPAMTVELADIDVAGDGGLAVAKTRVVFHFSASGFGLEKPASWIGSRRASGEIQIARGALIESIRRLERGVIEYENLIENIADAAQSLLAEKQLNARQIELRRGQISRVEELDRIIRDLRDSILEERLLLRGAQILADLAVEAIPDVLGFATDALSGAKAGLRAIAQSGMLPAEMFILQDETFVQDTQDEKNAVAALTELELFATQVAFNEPERLRQLEQLVRTEPAARLETAALEQSLSQAQGRYRAALARGLRLLEERTRFRQQTAAQIQAHRYKDMAFRLFRSDALQKYRAQFDLAARYAYLAAKAYDYETSLAPNDNRGPGSEFLTKIIRARSLGLLSNAGPLPGAATGDAGLADPLARMNSNWNLVLKGQLGFNNPQTETGRFSLRNELFRIVTGSDGRQRWRETLDRHVVANLLAMPEFQRHCIPFSPTQPVEPAIVIPFATTINFGLNFFGWPVGGGDNDYDSTKFATKVRSVGVWFSGYNNLGGGMVNTPRVYLIPVGLDVMRSPTQGAPYIREWRILDQALPVPFPLRAGDLNNPSFIPIQDTLNDDFAAIRRFGRFRAFHDSGSFNPAETISDSRLIGRSVWNTRWLLIIPAGTLHSDRNEGVQRFIHGALRPDGSRDGNGVSDIKIFFQTYAYSGN